MNIGSYKTFEPVMDYREFCDTIRILKNLNEQCKTETVEGICGKYEKVFCDKDKNLKNFLTGKPFICTCLNEGEKLTLTSSCDKDTLFVFLICCRRANNNIKIDNWTSVYLQKLIQRDRCILHGKITQNSVFYRKGKRK